MFGVLHSEGFKGPLNVTVHEVQVSYRVANSLLVQAVSFTLGSTANRKSF